jgi:voltage-gated potassium channel Kch
VLLTTVYIPEQHLNIAWFKHAQDGHVFLFLSFFTMQKIYTFMKQYILSIEIFVVFVLIFVAVVFFHHVEWISLFDSMYYTVITLAGVGYWDIVPKSLEGKVIAIWLASIGMPLFLLASTIFATKIIEGMKYHHYKQKRHLYPRLKRVLSIRIRYYYWK